ncbi:DegT/DnrJ/EryC1/StrS family aminotransferase [Tamlana crocina]|uniref:DegT/DnrJ/EryC1/StrS family aminotransferase n=1 Tax=Tamlana crocina TaxID=393006 RepID=A0ABX1D8K2_9FLAO|nr:DegT/DnrJ/EryC1/StrS family aminotransferase [Tamlana crocina]NJX14693.1 DegT/DnrJ/EryC1/StrS family aminotransferase [Tamlana crocina]
MIKFLDLKKINSKFEEAFKARFDGFLSSGNYILGKQVAKFESNFAEYCGSKYAIGVGNGLDAISLTFRAYIEMGKLKEGDEIIVPANTFIASVIGVLNAKLVPVFVEPRWETFNINPDLVEQHITDKTKAILPVHLYGQLCEMDKINSIAQKHNLLVVEDAAQAHGVSYNNTAEHSNPKAYSFYPGKNLGGLGDGGMVVTNDSNLTDTIKKLRNYGSAIKYENQYIGVNSRLDEIQAAFLNIKLPFLDRENEARRQIAKRYLSEIKNKKIILPYWDGSSNHVFHLFVVRTENRGALKKHLEKANIEALIHYPIPPHKQQALEEWKSLSLPITEKIHREVLSLPINSTLTDDEVSEIISAVNAF